MSAFSSSYGRYGLQRLRNVPLGNLPSGTEGRILRAAEARLRRRDAALMARRVPAPGYLRRGGYYGRMGSARRGAMPEMKFFDTTLSFLFDTTGEIPNSGQLTLITQGTGESQRDGRDVYIKSISIKGHMTLTPAAAATCSGNTHLFLILDTQANGEAATATTVFTSASFSVAHLNLANSQRFRIIKHWVHEWNPPAGATTAYNNVNQTLSYYKKCNIKVMINNTDGAITGIRSNNLFLMAGASAGIDDLVTFAGECRLRFVG